jgi:hypothetical protein
MITETITSWLVSKIAPTVAALLGGMTLFMFWTPKSLADKGKSVSAFIAGGVSATAGFVFSTTFLYWLGYSVHTLDLLLSGGFVIGFTSVGVFYFSANWIRKRTDQDPDQAITSVKELLK